MKLNWWLWGLFLTYVAVADVGNLAINLFAVNVWRKNIFDIYVTEYGTAFDNYFTYFVPVFKYCYSDNRNLWTVRQISQQPENCENRNDPDFVQAFLKKWWVESDFKAPNLPLSLRFKGSGCHYNSI
jgi:hypothetical protein